MSEPKDKTYREDEELNSIFVEFLSYLPYSEDDSIEVEAKHNALKAIQEHIEGEKYLNASEVLNEYLDSKDSNDQKVYMDGYLEWLKDRIKQLKDKGGK